MNLTPPLYQDLKLQFTQDFPGIDPVDWEYLISPLPVELKRSTLARIERGIHALHKVSRLPAYQKQIGEPGLLTRPNESVLMSYDFHTREDGSVALIEINTNASGFLVSALGLAAEKKISVFDLPEIADLKDSFLKELAQNGHGGQTVHVAIVDEDVDQQKMRIEFQLYKALFEKWGWSAEICESSTLKWSADKKELQDPKGKKIDFIYNRLTDFLLTKDKHQGLKTAWLEGQVTLSPQPKEYLLLADKSRLLFFQNVENLKALGVDDETIAAIQDVVLPVSEISKVSDVEALWKDRKNLFFKPKNSYGGKAVYRGESVSRKVFERLLTEDGLVQKYFPAQKLSTDPNHPLNVWKFDLRCFAHRDHLQMATARVYQGQVTNFSTRLGGFSSISIEN